jgi:hypothetical protein
MAGLRPACAAEAAPAKRRPGHFSVRSPSWQIVPSALPEFLGGPDAAGARRAMQAMLGMTKLDVAELRRAYEGKSAG